MAVHEKKESFKEHNDRGSILLAFYFVLTLLIPNLVLLYTEPYSIWSAEASLFIPMGFYLMWSAVLKRSGIMIWLAFPLVVLAAFQIVLLYLFGNSIIATDMFTNLLTTNPEEAGELLSNIYPSIIIVCAIYLPLLWFASRDIGQRHCLSKTARKNIALIGLSSFILGGLFLAPAYKVSEDKRVLKTDIFPVNVFYNIGLCGSEFRKMYRFEHTSEDFTYHARRTAEASKREIYVYVIGEASRAANWQLYGYHRETNPCLTRTEGLVVFRNTVTQSNTTHKSVPLILSSVKTDQHEELYRRKGLPALFKETGFKTWFLSNQRPQGAMIDKLAKDADSLVYLPEPRYDMQLLEAMKRVIAEDPEHDLLIILHCYGSHFTYHQRYPREFARFLPDDNVHQPKERRETRQCLRQFDLLYGPLPLADDRISPLARKRLLGAALLCRSRRRYSRRRTGALLARLPYDDFLSALCRQSGMVFAGISTGIPGKSRSGPQQRIRTGHNPLHVSKHGRYRFDRRRLHRSGLLVGQSDIRLPGTAPLSERSQPGRSFPENRPVG